MKDYIILGILRQFSNLQHFNEEEFNQIKSFFVYKEVKKNEYLYQYGDTMNAIYFLFSGKVKVYNTNMQGKEFLLNLYTDKAVFPHIGHYFYEAKYITNALATEDAKLFYIPTDKMDKIFSSSTTINLFFLSVMGKQTIDLQHRLEDKILGTTMEQITRMLIRLADAYGVQLVYSNEIILSEVLHNTELASIVGMTRETISRNMKTLYQEEIIRKDNRGRLVINIKKLNKFK